MNTPVQTIVNWLIESNWQASLLALLVISVQLIFGKTLTARWRYLLWLPVIIRLLIPALPESPASIYRYAPAADHTFTTEIIKIPATLTIPTDTQTLQTPISPTPVPAISAASPVTSAFHLETHTLLFLIWLTVTSLLAILFTRRNLLLFRRISSLASPVTPEIQSLADQARDAYKIKRHIPIRELSNLESPAIIGLFRPVILLPKNLALQLANDELSAIFHHELGHLKRGDLWMNLLCSLLQLIHWFNPVLWWSFARMRHDRELATDALAISVTRDANREHYGQTLIKLSANDEPTTTFNVGLGILENHKKLRQRIRQIAQLKPNAYAWSFLGIILILAISVLCLTKFTPEKLAPFPNTARDQKELRFQFLNLLANNNTRAVESYLQRGLNISGDTVNYHWSAISHHNNEVLKLLFKHDAKIPTDSFDFTCNFALEQADPAIIETLIANDCKFDPLKLSSALGELKKVKQIVSTTDLNRGQLISALCISSAAGQTETTRYLFEKCQPLKDDEKKRLAFVTAKHGRVSALQELDKLNIHAVDYANDMLREVVRFNHTQVLKYLFRNGAKPLPKKMSDALYESVQLGYVECAKILLENGADPNLAQEGWSRFPIIEAVFSRYYTAHIGQTEEQTYAIVKLLLDHGANADVRTEDNRSAAWLATSSPKVLRLLLEHGANVSGTNSRGETVLNEMIHVPAAFSGKYMYSQKELAQIDANNQEVVNLLVKAGADVNKPNSWGTPLVHAAYTGNIAIACALIENGADVNAVDRNGSTPISYAIFSGFIQKPAPRLISLLLDKGANPNTLIPTFNLTMIKFLAMAESNNSPSKNHDSDIRETVKILLSHDSLITDGKDMEIEKWFRAAASGDVATLKSMINKGQAIDATDSAGWTALMFSVPLKQEKVTRLLLDHGASLASITNDNLVTPLTGAIMQNDQQAVSRVLSSGKLDGRQSRLHNCLDLARELKDKTIFRQLLSAGFSPSNQSIYNCITDGDPESAHLLLEHGAVAESNDNSEHRENVYWAIQYNQPEILQMILDHRGDPTRKTTYNETPLSLAKQFQPKMVPMIEAAIAKWNLKSK